MSSQINSAPKVTRHQVEEWTVYKNSRKKFIYRQILNIVEYVVLAQIAFVISSVFAIVNIDIIYTLAAISICFSLFCLSKMTRYIIYLRRRNLQCHKKVHLWASIIKYTIAMSAYFQIFVYCIIKENFSIIAIIVQLLISYIIPIIVIIKSTNACFTFEKIIKTIFSTILFLQIALLLIYDGKSSFKYYYLFAPVWILGSISIVAFISSLGMMVSSWFFARKHHSKREEGKSMISIWRNLECITEWNTMHPRRHVSLLYE
jgi:hypothetical protein